MKSKKDRKAGSLTPGISKRETLERNIRSLHIQCGGLPYKVMDAFLLGEEENKVLTTTIEGDTLKVDKGRYYKI